MNHIQNLLSVAIIAILTFFAFGSPHIGHASQEGVDQFSCTNVTEIPQIECEALVALYNATDRQIGRDSTDWLVTNTPCSWYGVTCDEGHITQLDLSSIHTEVEGGVSITPFGLKGELPAEIGNLTNLTMLDLSWNSLSGLPPEIGNLTNLTELVASRNQLSSLPAEIGNLTNLISLEFSWNKLITLPPEIGNLTNLTELLLNSNKLRSLPADFTKLAALNDLNISRNNLVNLDAELQAFLDAKDPDWADSQKLPSGIIEPGLFSCTNITEIPQIECEALVALYNETDGPNWWNAGGWLVVDTPCIWDGVSCEDGHIIVLDRSFSGLQGDLPAEIGNLTNLTELDFRGNELNSVPPEIGDLTNLTKLSFADNQLSNLPAEIGNLTNLTELRIWSNQLSSLPPEIGDLTNLTIFYLSNNPLNNLLPEIGNLTNLTQLTLNNNQLSSLPPEIGNLTNLTSLYLQDNQLDNLPASFTQLVHLEELNVRHNNLLNIDTYLQTFLSQIEPDWAVTQSGADLCGYVTEIPRIECEALLAFYNATDGPNWEYIWGWLVTSTPCRWYGVNCEGGYVSKIKFSGLRDDYIDSQLKGDIPPEIGNFERLTSLDLSWNNLSSIPAEIGNLTNLTQLDLSYNQLSSLPTEINNLTNLVTLSLQGNPLDSLPNVIESDTQYKVYLPQISR